MAIPEAHGLLQEQLGCSVNGLSWLPSFLSLSVAISELWLFLLLVTVVSWNSETLSPWAVGSEVQPFLDVGIQCLLLWDSGRWQGNSAELGSHV